MNTIEWLIIEKTDIFRIRALLSVLVLLSGIFTQSLPKLRFHRAVDERNRKDRFREKTLLKFHQNQNIRHPEVRFSEKIIKHPILLR